nr:MAG TPA: hypothetical protein [Caudoviricetes sp.]
MIRRDNICVVGLLPFITWFRPDRVVLSVEGVSTTLQTQIYLCCRSFAVYNLV